jgi:hypothetical protein
LPAFFLAGAFLAGAAAFFAGFFFVGIKKPPVKGDEDINDLHLNYTFSYYKKSILQVHKFKKVTKMI